MSSDRNTATISYSAASTIVQYNLASLTSKTVATVPSGPGRMAWVASDHTALYIVASSGGQLYQVRVLPLQDPILS